MNTPILAIRMPKDAQNIIRALAKIRHTTAADVVRKNLNDLVYSKTHEARLARQSVDSEVMRQAIGRSSARDVYRRGTAHIRSEMPNDFANKQKGK